MNYSAVATLKISKAEEVALLDAAKSGDLQHIENCHYPLSVLTSIKDSSGCTMLHWSAGNNHEATLNYLLTSFHPDTPVTSKKAMGRTALHYACRNGHMSIVQALVKKYNADVNIRAKHGVTPFQLAIWQNQLHICTYLATECGIIPRQEMNDFGCGIIHWLGIVPRSRSDNIISLAKWIIEEHGIDIYSKQNQGHTVLHKASWGGQLELVKYLHEIHGMHDDTKDHAGNYAADLCDMANTPNHSKIASYLRKECSLEYRESCIILGIEKNSSEEEIRRAYLEKARLCHPDRSSKGGDGKEESNSISNSKILYGDDDFQLVKKAYEHLMSGGIATKQKNPAHSIHLLLENQGNAPRDGIANEIYPRDGVSDCGEEDHELKLFKTRLVAVLLEYGEKGLDLSNIPKKWNQVWPDVAFPNVTNIQERRNNQLQQTDEQNHDRKGKPKRTRTRKKGQLLRFIQEYAGEVVNITRVEDNGQVLISPKDISSYREKFPWVASNVGTNLK
uniref:J domain-containing protein n=1 Tax=Chaetoceros debilis TaxID=122233 RepID=A0A7S3PYF9_9STRA